VIYVVGLQSKEKKIDELKYPALFPGIEAEVSIE